MPTLEEQLRNRFPVPGLHFGAGQGGLPTAVVDTPIARGRLYLHGAHVTSFAPAGRSDDLLWVSRKSEFADGKPIRGGIPICFPWFAGKADAPDAPSHGLVRTKAWELTDAHAGPQGAITLKLQTTLDSFGVTLEATFAAELTLALTVSLAQTAGSPATFEQALHTYLRTEDIRQTRIHGLEDARYIDKTDGGRERPATDSPVSFDGETDRVYLETQAACRVDSSGGSTVRIQKENSANTVVWNPWADKASRMPDFGDSEWPEMVCVESANVADNAITLAPGESHTLRTTVSHVAR